MAYILCALKYPHSFVKPFTQYAMCLFLKVFSQNSWKLQMSFDYIKVVSLCCSVTIDLFMCYMFCQGPDLCTMGLQLSLKYCKFCNQCGFRKKSSTHGALLTFKDKIIQDIGNGEYAIGVFLDFSKVFATVDYKILLYKLDHYGIRGCALSWFRGLISRRLQHVT